MAPNPLIKFVLVGPGGTWLDMQDSRPPIDDLAARHPDCAVECWTYFELPDGCHSAPIKRRLAEPAYMVVRRGPEIEDNQLGQWRTFVRRCRCPGFMRYAVTLESQYLAVIVDNFDAQNDYGDESDTRRVHLSAVGHACAVADHLDKLPAWGLSSHVRRALNYKPFETPQGPRRIVTP